MAKKSVGSRARSAGDRRATQRRLMPPPGGAAIRMYRQGLGDCFLLAFAGAARSRPTYVLIDCGVHFAQIGGRAVMRQVVDDIAQATNGRLDVVVATHEHTDHLSAFVHEADRFLNGDLAIDRLWFAWTENERDPIARELRRGRTAAKQAIEAALQRLKDKVQTDRTALALSQRLSAANSFFEVEPADEEGGLTALAERLALRDPDKVTGNELALAVLKDRVAEPEYFRPGAGPLAVPGAASARVYVLGPPLDQALLNKSDPSGGDRHETYLTSAVGLLSFAAAAVECDPSDGDEAARRELCFPFDDRSRRDYAWAAEHPLFKRQYGFGDGHPEAWRQIESDWLHAAEELALHLDRHTNNTSLVLAFEIGPPGEGPVLLFVADAQVGNWLSWQQLAWTAAGRTIDVDDLFRRTLVYKVGHHASHNATLKRDEAGADYGLERIPDGLIALIPVDEAAASRLPGWDMPYKPLYDTLNAKTRGNMLRSDDGADPDLPVPRTRFAAVPGHTRVQWRRASVKKASGGPLYYDLALRAGD